MRQNLVPGNDDVYWEGLVKRVGELYEQHGKTEYAKQILLAVMNEIDRIWKKGIPGERGQIYEICKAQWDFMRGLSELSSGSGHLELLERETEQLIQKYKGNTFAQQIFSAGMSEAKRVLTKKENLCPTNEAENIVKDERLVEIHKFRKKVTHKR